MAELPAICDQQLFALPARFKFLYPPANLTLNLNSFIAGQRIEPIR